MSRARGTGKNLGPDFACVTLSYCISTVSLAGTGSSRPSIRKITLPISEFSFQFNVLNYDLGLYGSFVICDFDFNFAIKFRVLVFFSCLSVLKFLLWNAIAFL